MLTMTRYAVLLGLTIVVMLMLSPVMGKAVEKRRFISIGTGGPKDVYYAVGNAISTMVKREEDLCEGEIDAYLTGMGVPHPWDATVTEACGAPIEKTVT